jgi:hypothetical protein
MSRLPCRSAVAIIAAYCGVPVSRRWRPIGSQGSSAMSESEVKIQRWQRYIEECRREAKLLSPEGQRTMQSVIDSYERLIAMVRDQDKKKS